MIGFAHFNLMSTSPDIYLPPDLPQLKTFCVDFRFGYLKSPPPHEELCGDFSCIPEGYRLVTNG